MPVIRSSLIYCAIFCLPAVAGSFTYSNLTPDGRIATLSIPAGNGHIETETADDFIISVPTLLTNASIIGLLPNGAPLSSISSLQVDLYNIFPLDSNPASGNVPTRANSPSDVSFVGRSLAGGGLTFSAFVVNPSFTALNSVLNGINPRPNQFTGGEGAVTGQEVQIDIAFTQAILLAPGHYFFSPEVGLTSGLFFWLSAPQPAFTGDLETWIRNSNLAPDWERIGTDITHQGPFDAALALQGTTVPEPATIVLMAAGLVLLLMLKWHRPSACGSFSATSKN
jgi:hypothetical protein